jgi:hypothetical protein
VIDLRDPITRVSIGAAGLAIGAIMFHVAGYFYLYDDFAIVRIAVDIPTGTLAREAAIGFYRPLPFLLTRAQFLVLHWDHPSLYAGAAVALHGVNAGLVGLLARQLGLDRRSAVVAAALFGLSAPAAEGYFWLSSMFDRLCAFGMLVVLTAGVACVSAVRPLQAVGWAAIGVVGATIALMSKETAVVVPVAFAGGLGIGTVSRWPRTVAYATLLTLTSGGFLAWRQHLLPGLSGAYGDWRTLLSGAAIAKNAWSYVVAVLHPPLPWHDTSRVVGVAVTILWTLSATAWVLIVAALAWRRPRAAVGALLAVAVTLAPVLWAAIAPGTTASGRFLYVPGIWVALLAAAAIHLNSPSASGPSTLSGVVVRAAVAVVLVSQTVSVAYQARIWTLASRLSRQAMSDMKGYGKFERPLYIANLPAMFSEGPYILKDDAFTFFWGPAFKPRVRARRLALSVVDGQPRFASWMDSDDARPEERVIQLRLTLKETTPRTR